MNIIIVDDDKIVELSLKTILESTGDIQVVGTGNNGQEAIELYAQYQPDIVLLDIHMPEKNGLEAAKEIIAKDSQAKVLFLTTFSDNDYIVKALKIGAKGYILKQEFECIAPALYAVMSGQSVFGKDIVEKLPNLLQQGQPFHYGDYGVSEKEEEVIELVAQGLNNKEISEQLYLSVGTVRNYLSNILEKLSLRDRTQLAIFHYKNKMK